MSPPANAGGRRLAIPDPPSDHPRRVPRPPRSVPLGISTSRPAAAPRPVPLGISTSRPAAAPRPGVGRSSRGLSRVPSGDLFLSLGGPRNTHVAPRGAAAIHPPRNIAPRGGAAARRTIRPSRRGRRAVLGRERVRHLEALLEAVVLEALLELVLVAGRRVVAEVVRLVLERQVRLEVVPASGSRLWCWREGRRRLLKRPRESAETRTTSSEEARTTSSEQAARIGRNPDDLF